MEASTRNTKIDLSRYLIKDEKYIVNSSVLATFLMGNTFEHLQNMCADQRADSPLTSSPSDVIELAPEGLKAVIDVHDKFYHFFAETFPLILKVHRLYPDITFILYIKQLKHIKSDTFLEVLFDCLDSLGVKYIDVRTPSEEEYSPVYKISNFLTTDKTWRDIHATLTLKDIEYAASYLKSRYIVDTEKVKPFRRVYLSGKFSTEIFGWVDTDNSYRNDVRLYKEEKLRKFFMDAGYEYVNPEQKFSTIAEQIRFMSEVSVLASVSSSGLTNALFMQPGGKVIEVVAEIVVPKGPNGPFVSTRQSIPFEYHPLSFIMGHTHLMIPTNRDADVAIEKLKAAGISN